MTREKVGELMPAHRERLLAILQTTPEPRSRLTVVRFGKYVYHVVEKPESGDIFRVELNQPNIRSAFVLPRYIATIGKRGVYCEHADIEDETMKWYRDEISKAYIVATS